MKFINLVLIAICFADNTQRNGFYLFIDQIFIRISGAVEYTDCFSAEG